MVFGRRRTRKPPPPPLDEHGRPLVVRWSPEHLARLCAEHPSFQVMSVDGLQWIDPFTKHLIPAAFDWQQAAITWMCEQQPWRQQDKPLPRQDLYAIRWAHFLRHHINEQSHLRFFLTDGRWLNPLSGEWVADMKPHKGPIDQSCLSRMARSLADTELKTGSSKLKEAFDLKAIYDRAHNDLQRQQQQREDQNISRPLVTVSEATHQPPRAAVDIKTPAHQGGSSGDHSSGQHDHPSGASSRQLRELHSAGYRLGECLGRGGMAAVYKAVQLSLEREVALKVRFPDGDEFTTFVERFLREARMAAKVSHPNVATIYDVGRTPSLVYMALEYLSGGDLDAQLRRSGPFCAPEALRCLADILRGLSAIHDHGLIHRDIKTANCFIAKDGRISVGDLGIARDQQEIHHITNPKAIVGTPAFMAPEQSVPGGQLDGRSDIYSAGVVAYHLLSGELPFDGENPLVILRKMISQPIPDLRDTMERIDPRVAALVHRFMDKDPDMRPVDARAALAETEALSNELKN